MNLRRSIFFIYLAACWICVFASEPVFRVRYAKNCSFIKNGKIYNEGEKVELSLNDSIFFRNNTEVRLEDMSKERNHVLRNLYFERIFGKYCLKDIINTNRTKDWIEDVITIIFPPKGSNEAAQGEKGENKDSLMLVKNIKYKIEGFYKDNGINFFSDFNNLNGFVAKYDETENILFIKNNLDIGLYIDIMCLANGDITSCLSKGKDFVSKLWINKGKTMKLAIKIPEKAFIVGSEIALPYNHIMRVNMDDFIIKESRTEIFLQMIKIK